MSASVTALAIPVVIGVDIGGTNTDVAILRQNEGIPRILAEIKETTSSDVTTGVRKAVLKSLLQAKEKNYLVSPVQVNIGTTHFVNAVVQGKELTKVAALRICGPVSEELPPFCDFPSRLVNIICGSVHLIHGGMRFDGKERESLNENEIRQIVHEVRERGIENVAIVGVFSPTRPDQELKAREIVLDEFPTASVSLSHEIGHIGLLERENATILNECLKPLCKKTVTGFASALEDIGVTCPLFLTQNDGTIISSTDVLKYPVFTIASGPTNSMRGAAFLSETKDAIVVDIGGTTTDVGVLKGGFPREASTHARVGGVRTNFRMPEIISIGLGGGSYVQERKSPEGTLLGVKVGPLSAGLNLEKEAFVFAEDEHLKGRSLTATDIAVAAGLCNLGCRNRVKGKDPKIVAYGLEEIHKMLEDLVDKIKLSKENLPVIIVGGGSVLIDMKRSFKGASELILPKYFGVANAIGAALSKVAVTSIEVVNLLDLIDNDEMENAVKRADETHAFEEDQSQIDLAVIKARKSFMTSARSTAIENVMSKAKVSILRNGGRADTLDILEKQASVLAYLPGNVIQIKVKVVSDLARLESASSTHSTWKAPVDMDKILLQEYVFTEKQSVSSTGQHIGSSLGSEREQDVKLSPTETSIDPATGEWVLNEWDVECIVVGAGIYGCGGGGNPYMSRLRVLKSIRDGKRLRVISPERMLTKDNKHIVIASASMGAPLVSYEQGVSSFETAKALECLRDLYEIGHFLGGNLQNSAGAKIETTGSDLRYIENYQPAGQERTIERRIIGLMSCEIGGMNAIEPFLVAADMGLPVVDCDGMSRAFPELQMFIPFMYGKPPYPATIVGSGNHKERTAVLYCSHNKDLENYLRNVTIQNGCTAGVAFALNEDEIINKTALYTVSSAWRLGNAVLRARLKKEPVIDAVVQQENAKHVMTGRITDVSRETTGGFDRGCLIVEGIDEWKGQEILIEFQNENLVIIAMENGEKGACLGSVPDLISVIDANTAEPIPTEEVRYGLRVAVVLMPCHHLLRQPEALKWVGPQAFHYPETVKYKPFKERLKAEPIPPIP